MIKGIVAGGLRMVEIHAFINSLRQHGLRRIILDLEYAIRYRLQ